MTDFAEAPNLDLEGLGRQIFVFRIPGESDIFYRERVRSMIKPDLCAIKRLPESIPAEVRLHGLSEHVNGSIICDGRSCFVVIDGVGYYLPAKGMFKRAYYCALRVILSAWRKAAGRQHSDQ